MLASWHWHIEISSKCTLKCPRCARQEVPDGLVNTELDLEFFQRNFTPEFVIKNVEKITFCGDDGDPIYAHDLIEVIKYLKSIKDIEIVIITNGSYKKPDWWASLGRELGSRDSVHFSVDGYDNESNNIYRINSDYDSIIEGLTSLRANSSCQIVWAVIAFKFNQYQLGKMKDRAKAMGVDRFQLTKSTKFGSVYANYGTDDNLEPRTELISSTLRFEREIYDFTNKTTAIPIVNLELYKSAMERNDTIVPLCEIGNKGLYIDARGRFFPCCWVANRYNHNSEWQSIAKNFDLTERTLTDVLSDAFWETDLKSFRWNECQSKCTRGNMNENYCTSW